MDTDDQKIETIILGGGCFWCVEAALHQVRGVVSVTSGYAGGSVPDPTYEQVCSGRTGHAEVVKVVFDATQIQLETILFIFFTVHDPTTKNRQGADIGTQYRSVIFYTEAKQTSSIDAVISKLNDGKIYDSPIVTEIQALDSFYPAEDYHQNYYTKNPEAGYCRAVINPKLQKMRKQFLSVLK